MSSGTGVGVVAVPAIAAAIDIGSNAIRMVIAQRMPDGTIEYIEELHQSVLLGHDTFTNGKIGKKAMQSAISVLRDFAGVIKSYKVDKVRVVATSAVREASNADVFLDRILIATGMEVELIDTSEESRLIVSSIYELAAQDEKIIKGNVLVVVAGGGNTIMTIVNNGDIVASHTIGLGAVKLLEEYYSWQTGWDDVYRQAAYRLNTFVDAARNVLSLNKIDKLFLIGSDIRFIAQRAGEMVLEGLSVLPGSVFEDYVKRFKEYTPSELAVEYEDITLSTAETMNPTFAIYNSLVKQTKVKEIYVPYINMRDGLITDVLCGGTFQSQEFTWREAKHSACILAEKYQITPDEYDSVLSWSQKLFDVLMPLHKMYPREKVMLELAAILHRVGTFISVRAHHKHTYYIIANSEIFGLSNSDLNQVAHIARYYRRSTPKPTHISYMALDRRQRIVVNKLASILRLAVSLANVAEGGDVSFEVTNDRFQIEISGSSLRGRSKSIRRAAAMLEDIFCISVEVRS